MLTDDPKRWSSLTFQIQSSGRPNGWRSAKSVYEYEKKRQGRASSLPLQRPRGSEANEQRRDMGIQQKLHPGRPFFQNPDWFRTKHTWFTTFNQDWSFYTVAV